ncbi:hypothetical protein PYW07_014851 [Mythimna separata]|uniref:Uncharacterized protein n=1 Tax=Mythimna separata TaxID=271217 RepID=A0AAD7Z2P3_MYTSE|nr:hypothetical protein PYW07_014851 [Mythimna separata]
MYCPYKNSYLQLTTSVDPKLVNKAVRRAMRKTQIDPHDERPPAQRLTSMQPSLYAPWTDISRARMGFERVGLRTINRNICSEDSFIQLQAIHSLLDQVQISESALFLIDLNIVYRLIKLLEHRDPIVKEKVCLILAHLGNYFQGRTRILSDPIIIDHLMFLFMRDRKEIRYAAAYCLRQLTRYGCEMISKNEKIIENLLKVIKNDHVGIVVLHLESLKNLTDWDPVEALKANGFQVMLELIEFKDERVVQGAMECLRQLCKHSIGKKLADKYDMTRLLVSYLYCEDLNIVISTVGLLMYTTLTTKAKWRLKEFQYQLSKRLVWLCLKKDVPVLQLRAMQVLINMCEVPDCRNFIKETLDTRIRDIKIRKADQWDGTTDTKHYGVDIGHLYRTRYVPGAETIKVCLGDNAEALNVESYRKRVVATKQRLIHKMNSEPSKN